MQGPGETRFSEVRAPQSECAINCILTCCAPRPHFLVSGFVVPYPPSVRAPDCFRSTGTVAGDINSNGRADLVGDAPNQSSIGVLLNHGRTLFDTAVAYSTFKQPPSGMTIGDFNGDGMPEIVVGADDGTELFLSRGGGRYSPPIDLPTGADPFPIVAADLRRSYCSFAYSAFVSRNSGTSGSASFHSAKKFWYSTRLRALSPCAA